jgi:hypothetical protein
VSYRRPSRAASYIVATGECRYIPASRFIAGMPMDATAPCSTAGNRLFRLSRADI